MVRIVNEQEYAQRRNAILDATNRLLLSRGYEQMTILDIVEELQISKGAFYHYFDSKQAAFSALLERMGQELDRHLFPLVEDSTLPALEKLQRFFDALAGWKQERLSVLLAVTRVWYSDDNTLIRSHLRRERHRRLVPLLATIMREGCQQGILRTDSPLEMGEVVVSLLLDLGDALAEILLSMSPGPDLMQRLERTLDAYTQTLLRALQLPRGSITLVDPKLLRQWFLEVSDSAE